MENTAVSQKYALLVTQYRLVQQPSDSENLQKQNFGNDVACGYFRFT